MLLTSAWIPTHCRRGTLDDKNALICTIEAFEALIASGFQPRRTMFLAFGHDEEVGGRKGAALVRDHLKNRNVQLEYVLDEGGAIVKDAFKALPGRSIAVIGIAEKVGFGIRPRMGMRRVICSSGLASSSQMGDGGLSVADSDAGLSHVEADGAGLCWPLLHAVLRNHHRYLVSSA